MKTEDLFTKLAQIPSPTGLEAKVCLFIKKYFDNLGWKTWVDKYGNLYAYLGLNKTFETMTFSAHMDTVQKPGDKIKVLFDGKTFKSDGTTILGADNKAGVAALMMVAQTLKTASKYNILYFFPTHEEAGIMGSGFFKFDKKIKFIFNLDNGDNPGVFITKGLGYENFKIEVYGKTAHAAKNYEKGINAINIASELILKLPIGKNTTKGFTMNVGVISGGKSTNVVCDLVELKGELRAFNNKTFTSIHSLIKKTCLDLSAKTGAKIKFLPDKESFISPFAGSSGEIQALCQDICAKLKLKCEFKTVFATSDVNKLAGLGFDVITVSRGGTNAHSVYETLKLSDIIKTIELIAEIVKYGRSS